MFHVNVRVLSAFCKLYYDGISICVLSGKISVYFNFSTDKKLN